MSITRTGHIRDIATVVAITTVSFLPAVAAAAWVLR